MTQNIRWRKADLHTHCNADPVDYRTCTYSPEQLISEAARLGYEILAITCHNLDIWNRELSEYAESLGVTLIPGMEVSTEGRRHLLAYNFRTGCENLSCLDKIRERAREDTLVIAPHPFYPGPTCLAGLVERHADIVDALEISGFYTRLLDFNRGARRVAGHRRKPLVGNSDTHFLWQMGRTFTWIYSEPGVLAAIDAVKRGRVRVESVPLSPAQAAGWWAASLLRRAFPANPKPRKTRLEPIYD